MQSKIKQDNDNIQTILSSVTNIAVQYLQNIDTKNTTTNKINFAPNNVLHNDAIGTQNAIELFIKRLETLLVSSSGPRYWGFVTGGATPAAIVGDWLTSIYDNNTQSTNAQGGLAALIEIETINLLLDLLKLPSYFFGGFVTGATMSNFTCLAVARQWVGNQNGINIAQDGIQNKIIVMTATPHSSSIKSLSMLGIGNKNIIVVDTLPNNSEAIDTIDFEKKIIALQGKPFILISSAGTVNTADFDDFSTINKLQKKYNFWWHIDAAFGAFAICSSMHKHLLNAWENADSITVDCHKWLNVPYQSGVFFVQKKYHSLQIETFKNNNAPYLGSNIENINYLDLLPENSRRLTALPTWFTLNAYGKEGLINLIETSTLIASYFAQKLESSGHFILQAPVRLNIVCFTLKKHANTQMVFDFLKEVNEMKIVFMTPTTYKKQQSIRAAFVNWRTTKDDVDMVLKAMLQLKNYF